MVESQKKPIRVRLAPSPTGPLHLGTVRTGLFNWLFARQHDGALILRIEDTDRERSTRQFEEDIITGLKWLGIDWDEGPDVGGPYKQYRQSERIPSYEKYIVQLLEKNLAYYCFCTNQQLIEEREAMLAQGVPPKYSGRCRHIKPEEAEQRAKNEPSVIRFKIREAEISFSDMIRGKISFDTGLMGDVIIAKDTKTPLYNLAVVIDDQEMQISHVIRGEDHIANTPKQILIQEALEFDQPYYAHLPLILAPDRSKLSKRYLETSIADYRGHGYLPMAIINFLALLGWHPAPEQDAEGKSVERELFTKEELLKVFDIKRVQKGGAAFSIEKLDWMNGQYIKSLPPKKLAEHLGLFIPEPWKQEKDKLFKIIELEQGRMKKLNDFKELAQFFFELPEYPAELLIWKDAPREKILAHLEEIKKILGQGGGEKEISIFAETHGRGDVLWALRVALSGASASPSPFEIMNMLDAKEIEKRIATAIKKLS